MKVKKSEIIAIDIVQTLVKLNAISSFGRG